MLQYFVVFLFCFASYSHGEKSLKVDIYPGFGWDHLRFIDMNPLFDVSNFNNSDVFQSCIEMIPLHENNIETGSTIIDSFDERTDDNSLNFMVGGSLPIKSVKIGGSYSYENQKIKKEQGEQGTITLRNHIDYLMVDVLLQQTCPLNVHVKKDLIEIAKLITLDQNLRATYAAQLFVKKYGTHFTSRLQLGGSISEDDYISHANFNKDETEKSLHKAAAELSFLSTFSITSSFSSAKENAEVAKRKENISRKVINSKGGDVFTSGNHMEVWQQSVKSRPAIIRRAIENMTYIIQSEYIPELTDVALAQVRKKINDAIDTYVEMNIIRGCMHRDSPSFNWIANVDDGSCVLAEQTSLFGGFIRNCTEDEILDKKCDQYQIDNFYTGTDECKTGFSKYLLHKSIQTENVYHQNCYDCGFLWLSTCCDSVYAGRGQRELELYSCYKNITQELASTIENIESTHVFGGSFTSKKVNPITDAYSCPNGFTETNSFDDVKICLAENVLHEQNTYPRYGGMFSCDYGNIATEFGDKTCPRGYSVYVMGAIDGDCLINVCLKFQSFAKVRHFPSIVLPPFFDFETVNRTRESNETISEAEFASRMGYEPKSTHQGNSHRIKLGLSIGAVVAGVTALATVGGIQLIKYRKRRAEKNNNSNMNTNADVAVINT